MEKSLLFLGILTLVGIASGTAIERFDQIDKSTLNEEELKVLDFIKCIEKDLAKDYQLSTLAHWAYATNVTEETEAKKLLRDDKANTLNLKIGIKAKTYNLEKIHHPVLKRVLKGVSNIGSAVLPKEERDLYSKQSNDIINVFIKAKVPKYKEPETLLSYTPDIRGVFINSRDPEELEHYWSGFREVTGPKMRETYLKQLELTRKVARLNGFKDAAVAEVDGYDSDTFIEEIEEAMEGLMPLYEQLHAYVRHRLMKAYPDLVTEDGPLPVHLMGHNDGIEWQTLLDILLPYPDKPSIEVTPAMVEQGWTVERMFKESEHFFESMGLPPMRQEFWDHSMFERPADGREVQCHASAWDFYDAKNFRIKMCSKVRQSVFNTVTHEMGHTQYQMAYSNLSVLFRNGANSGFHEAVADVQSLAASTISNYKRLQLIDQSVDEYEEETNINALMSAGLSKIAFMPYAFILDRWRWDLLQDKVNPEDINCHWHKLRHDIQGVVPPNKRTEEHMDTGAKYHVAQDVAYVRYFTAALYQYQFYEAMCLASGNYVPDDPKKPLHMCNFYGSKVAGDKLMGLLKQGSSKPWPEIMHDMTGQSKMDSSSFRKYFKTLEDWLIKENERNGVKVGWTKTNYEDFCSK